MLAEKEKAYGELIAVGWFFKFNSSHKPREHSTQYTGLIEPSTICHSASRLSDTFFDQFSRAIEK
jgi:hypothetical protein